MDFNQNEERIIANVWLAPNLGNAISAIQLSAPLVYMHYGGFEYQAEVALLSRNIVIKSELNYFQVGNTACFGSAHGTSSYPCTAAVPNGFGGHIIVQGTNSIGRVTGVQLYRMGKRIISW